jgi:putative oxidoreductase
VPRLFGAARCAYLCRWRANHLLEAVVEKPGELPVWIASALVTLYVGAAGLAKLAGVPYVHSSFPKLGLPAWFGYFVGVCEVLGPIALFIRPLSAWAAAGLGFIMIGATYYHAMYTPIIQAVPAFVLLILCVYIFWKRRPKPALTA